MNPFGRLDTDTMDVWRGTRSVDGGLTRSVRTRILRGEVCRICRWSPSTAGDGDWPDGPEVYRLFTPPGRLLRGDKVVVSREEKSWTGLVTAVFPGGYHDEAAIREITEEML